MKRSSLRKSKPTRIGLASQPSLLEKQNLPKVKPLKAFSPNIMQRTKLDWLLEMFEPEFNYIDTTESEARLVVKARNPEG